MKDRNRIKGLVRLMAGQIRPNPANYRKHDDEQRATLGRLLDKHGWARALLVRPLAKPDEQGRTHELVNGEGRWRTLPSDQIVPCLELDLTEDEARDALLVIDPLSAMADHDPAMLTALLEQTEDDPELESLRAALAIQAGQWEFGDQGGTEPQGAFQWKAKLNKQQFARVTAILHRVREATGKETHVDQIAHVVSWWRSRRSASGSSETATTS